MSGKFTTKDKSLIFDQDGKQEVFKLPYHESELVGVKAFVSDLNRRASKLDMSEHKVQANNHYVFIGDKIKVKFPDVKGKHIDVDEETHTMAKAQAALAGIPMNKYVKLCLIQCRSGLKD